MNRFLRELIFLMCIGGLIYPSLIAQVNYTAKDTIIPYEGFFRPGSNLGEYLGLSDEQLGDLAAGNEALGVKGVGVKALRPALYEDFVKNFGYDSRISTYQHYATIDLKDNTVIVGFPSDEHRDQTQYCDGIKSTLFKNMYTDIWDDGENGTPINDENYYAAYIFELVSKYKDYVKFWEIWNEPGFDYTKNRGWLPPGAMGNWWENNPDPCDYKLRAPIFHYVRLLRISYEVIKSIDPEAYVTVSGVGFPSFLDAILRNTDNPTDGSVTQEFPHGGGAYFDIMGYHFYPHFDGSLQKWNQEIQDWDYFRHSDAASDGMLSQKNIYQEVLHDYGYDGQTFPAKQWIITECNLPRRAFDNYIGSDEAQRNFMIKAIVKAMKNEILQLHIYKLGEDTEYEKADFEFDLMGFYKKLKAKDLYFNDPTLSAIAHHSASDILFEKTYDPIRTADLQLPPNIEGGAFKDVDGNYTYVFWARTNQDKSEAASAVYSFPLSLNINELLLRKWDYSETHFRETVGGNNISLTATPIFLTEMMFSANVMSGCAPLMVQFDDHTPVTAASWNWTFESGSPANSSSAKPTIIFNAPGNYEVTVEIKDANGNIISKQRDEIRVSEAPVVDFSKTISGPIVVFDNLSSTNNDSFLWDFGDGNTSTEANPTHLFIESGRYIVKLTGTNDCSSIVNEQVLEIVVPTNSQLVYTANDSIIPYEGNFRPGVNLKFYPPWTDEQLADIAAGNIETNITGAGIKAIRTLLPEYFLTGWTYDIRKQTFQHYVNLDLGENTAVLGFPSVASRDQIAHCTDSQSELFTDMYIDIWDDGSDGTLINEANPFALYIYNTAIIYKDYVKFWQILNAPGIDVTGEKGWLPPGEPGNWWEDDPDPCDLVLKAPIFHYIRMLRISYEVIKYVDPEAYVTVSGVGFPSFLDALLRNTDNPLNGSVSTGYPLKAGAYFDAFGFNVYPYVDGSTSYFDLDQGSFVFQRHSDAAVSSIPNNKNKFQAVLEKYGYDGISYPQKQWVISGCNIPRRPINGYIGSDEAQRNFIIKAYIASVENDIRQLGIEALAETQLADGASSENDVMGIYKKIEGQTIGQQELTDEGIAYKTTSDLLFGAIYDQNKTEDMQLSDDVRGAAFRNVNGNYIYVLWAKTSIDKSEEASAIFSFPNTFDESQLIKREWDYSTTQKDSIINLSNIVLTGAPIFLLESEELLQPPLALFTSNSQKDCTPFTVNFTEQAIRADSFQWSFPGGMPASSFAKNPTVTYNEPGIYTISLEVINAAGRHKYSRLEYITADSIPSADFEFSVDGAWASLKNRSVNATSYVWEFGDGTSEFAFDPNHFYYNNGDYEVKLIAQNNCGNDTITQMISISTGPVADFQFISPEGCSPFEVQFQDLTASSPTSWTWTFQGGGPAQSTLQNPVINFAEAGAYDVQLIVENENGVDTILQNVLLSAGTIHRIDQSICSDESIEINGIIYNHQNPQDTQVLEMGGSLGCDSLIIIDLRILDYKTEIIDTIEDGQSYQLGNKEYSSTGIYEDTLKSQEGCDSIVILDLTVLTVSTQNPLINKLAFKVFPNPFNEQLTINFTLPGSGECSIELIDIFGRKAKTILGLTDLSQGSHQFKADTESLSEGVYYCRLVYKNEMANIGIIHFVNH